MFVGLEDGYQVPAALKGLAGGRGHNGGSGPSGAWWWGRDCWWWGSGPPSVQNNHIVLSPGASWLWLGLRVGCRAQGSCHPGRGLPVATGWMAPTRWLPDFSPFQLTRIPATVSWSPESRGSGDP